MRETVSTPDTPTPSRAPAPDAARCPKCGGEGDTMTSGGVTLTALRFCHRCAHCYVPPSPSPEAGERCVECGLTRAEHGVASGHHAFIPAPSSPFGTVLPSTRNFGSLPSPPREEGTSQPSDECAHVARVVVEFHAEVYRLLGFQHNAPFSEVLAAVASLRERVARAERERDGWKEEEGRQHAGLMQALEQRDAAEAALAAAESRADALAKALEGIVRGLEVVADTVTFVDGVVPADLLTRARAALRAPSPSGTDTPGTPGEGG